MSQKSPNLLSRWNEGRQSRVVMNSLKVKKNLYWEVQRKKINVNENWKLVFWKVEKCRNIETEYCAAFSQDYISIKYKNRVCIWNLKLIKECFKIIFTEKYEKMVNLFHYVMKKNLNEYMGVFISLIVRK